MFLLDAVFFVLETTHRRARFNDSKIELFVIVTVVVYRRKHDESSVQLRSFTFFITISVSLSLKPILLRPNYHELSAQWRPTDFREGSNHVKD